MSRYDVYPNPDGAGYLLDVQTDILGGLNTRVVVLLLPADEAPEPADRLNPVFSIDGQQLIMGTQFLAAVPISILKLPVDNLSEQYLEITNALGMVFQGF